MSLPFLSGCFKFYAGRLLFQLSVSGCHRRRCRRCCHHRDRFRRPASATTIGNGNDSSSGTSTIKERGAAVTASDMRAINSGGVVMVKDRQTERRTDRETDRQTGRQTHGQTDCLTDRRQ